MILSGGPGYRFAECVSIQVKTSSPVADFKDTDGSFDVRDEASGARRAWILQELGKARTLKAPDVAEHLSCSVKTAQRDLTALKDEGRIEFVGAPRTGFYRLCQPASP